MQIQRPLMFVLTALMPLAACLGSGVASADQALAVQVRLGTPETPAPLGPWGPRGREGRFTRARQVLLLDLIEATRDQQAVFAQELEATRHLAQGLPQDASLVLLMHDGEAGVRRGLRALRATLDRHQALWSDPLLFRAALADGFSHLPFATPQLESLTRLDLRIAVQVVLRALWKWKTELTGIQLRAVLGPLSQALLEQVTSFKLQVARVPEQDRDPLLRKHLEHEERILEQTLTGPLLAGILARHKADSVRLVGFVLEGLPLAIPQPLEAETLAWLPETGRVAHAAREQEERRQWERCLRDLRWVWLPKDPAGVAPTEAGPGTGLRVLRGFDLVDGEPTSAPAGCLWSSLVFDLGFRAPEGPEQALCDALLAPLMARPLVAPQRIR